MTVEKVNEVPFTIRRRQRGKLGQYWATMGFIFQIVRDIDPQLKYLIDTFTLIGLLWSLKRCFLLVSSLFSGFRVHIWSKIWKLNLKKLYGDWVVITGSTDGIGLEYAREFASRGHSLILIARNESKLETVKRELSDIVGRDNVVIIVADFEDTDPELYKRIQNQLKPYLKDIGILVNNAGAMLHSPKRFMDQDEDNVMQMVKVNITSVLMMTRAVLPGMIARRKGLIINMSSLSGFRPLPLMGAYSASKKFVEYFSKTLELEYTKSHNIHVQTLIPSYISTKMTKWSNTIQRSSIFTPDARTFVRSAVGTIGRSSYTTGYWMHGIQYFFSEWFVPDKLYDLSSWNVLRALDSTSSKNKTQ